MEVSQILSMKGGTGNTSYATNSALPGAVIAKAKPAVEENIKKVVAVAGAGAGQCLKMADLGCSSGPNSLTIVSQMLEAVAAAAAASAGLNHEPPALQVFLNDLPGNDFNSLFKSLPGFLEAAAAGSSGATVTGRCFVYGAPGSFYGNLFPENSMHFFHSSYGLHWLSQVPGEVERGEIVNKGNICITKRSPPAVFKAYFEQFSSDFSLFLRLRSEEMVPKGGMVLTLMGCIDSHDPSLHWELLARALNDMVFQGLIPEEKVDSFNLPFYGATAEEVRRLIEEEGSFSLNRIEVLDMDWDPDMNRDVAGFDGRESGKVVSDSLRTAGESLLKHHFGEEIMDDLFGRFTEKLVERITTENWHCTNLIISLTRKDN